VKQKIREILELVGLEERAASLVGTFSKGMKQRLGIAQALLHDPELLILDEPASGLDPGGNRDIRDLIRFLNKEKGKTIILSSHNLAEIEMIANRMVIINKGRKVIEGNVLELLTEQSYRTRFAVDDPKKALRLLHSSSLISEDPEISEKVLAISCTRQIIPDINAVLVQGGLRVESIRMEQNLEDYFLNMTWNEDTP
jgi:ABC-2 type transport system ATP-binding protein